MTISTPNNLIIITNSLTLYTQLWSHLEPCFQSVQSLYPCHSRKGEKTQKKISTAVVEQEGIIAGLMFFNSQETYLLASLFA